MGTCTSLPQSDDAVRAMSPQQRRFSDMQLMSGAGAFGADAEADQQARRDRIAGSVILLEPPLLAQTSEGMESRARDYEVASAGAEGAAPAPRKRSLSSGERGSGVRRTASDMRRGGPAVLLCATTLATASSSTKPSPTHTHAPAQQHASAAALAVLAATATSSTTSSAAPSRPTSARTHAINATAIATSAPVVPVHNGEFATTAAAAAAAAAGAKDAASGKKKKKKTAASSTKKLKSNQLQTATTAQRKQSRSAYQSRAASPAPPTAPGAKTPPASSAVAAAAIAAAAAAAAAAVAAAAGAAAPPAPEYDEEYDDEEEEDTRPPVLRRQQSLEDEEDEKTARSLRNFEAEHVLAEQAAHICTMQLLQQEAAAAASTHVSRRGSPFDSRSPSDSRNNSPRPHAHLRSLLYGASMAPLHAQAVAATSGSVTPNGAGGAPSATSHLLHPYQFLTPSPTAASVSAVVSPAHTPRPDASTTPRSERSVQHAHAHTLSTSATAPYANAEILDSSAVIYTPTGKRTALALLMSGNNSARTSPKGPSGQRGNLFGVPSLSVGGSRAASAHPAGHFNFSKTVPNSPRSLSPVGGRQSGAHTPRVGLAGGVMSMSSGATSPSRHSDASNNGGGGAAGGAPRLLAVPGGLNSPRGSSGGSISSGGSSSTGAHSRQLRSHLARLAPRRFGTGTAAGGALYPQPATLPVYSHSVQTSPRRRSREGLQSVGGEGGTSVFFNVATEDASEPTSPPHGAGAVSGAPGGSLHMGAVGVGVGVGVAVEQELFEKRPVGHTRALIHRRANTAASGAATGAPTAAAAGAHPSIVTSGAVMSGAAAGAASQPASASYKRFAARLKMGSGAAKQVEQAWASEAPHSARAAGPAGSGVPPHPHTAFIQPRIVISPHPNRFVVGEAATAGPAPFSGGAMHRRRNSKP